MATLLIGDVAKQTGLTAATIRYYESLTTMAILQSALFAAVAGFLTRPCCVIPAALSLAGVGTAGLSSVVVTHRPLFLASSAVSMGVSTWLTFRQTGGTFNKMLAVIAIVVVFFITAGYIGVLDVL